MTGGSSRPKGGRYHFCSHRPCENLQDPNKLHGHLGNVISLDAVDTATICHYQEQGADVGRHVAGPCTLISLDLFTCIWVTSSVTQSGAVHSEVSRRLSRPGLHSILSFTEHLKSSARMPVLRGGLFRR